MSLKTLWPKTTAKGKEGGSLTVNDTTQVRHLSQSNSEKQ